MTFLRLVPLFVLAACATRSAIDESRYHTSRGDALRAYLVLEQLRSQQLANGGEVEPGLEEEHQRAYLAYLFARAQERIFEEEEELALGDLAELQSMAPDHPGVEALRERALKKRASRYVERGEDHLRGKDYVAALAQFEQALAIDPHSPGAKDGIKTVFAATERMSKRAREQFLEAVRKLPELRYREVQWHASNALHNTPKAQDAKSLEGRARRENAERAVARAEAAEGEGLYGAALVEYREALRLDATLPGLADAIAAMEREMRAAALVDRAQIEMHAARFDHAHELLGEAFELSLMARNDIAKVVQQARRLQGEHQYRAARDLEVLGKKAEALAAYEALHKQWPDGIEDEQARIEGLRADVDGANREWAEAEAAEAAGDAAKAIEHYRTAERFYPGFKDAKARIERLRAAVEPPAGEPAPGGDPAPGGGNGTRTGNGGGEAGAKRG
jgi:tetratricopeptide (TPR) repeat protein